jgi:hypothetical protein
MEKLSIKQLKEILHEANIRIPSGIEKPELVALAQQVQDRKHATEAPPYTRIRKFGAKLEECKAIFLLFHGYGADEHQFAFFENHASKDVCFVCPKSSDEGRFITVLMSDKGTASVAFSNERIVTNACGFMRFSLPSRAVANVD